MHQQLKCLSVAFLSFYQVAPELGDPENPVKQRLPSRNRHIASLTAEPVQGAGKQQQIYQL